MGNINWPQWVKKQRKRGHGVERAHRGIWEESREGEYDAEGDEGDVYDNDDDRDGDYAGDDSDDGAADASDNDDHCGCDGNGAGGGSYDGEDVRNGD